MRLFILLIASLCICDGLYAQMIEIDTDKALEIALKNNKEYRAAEIRAEKSELDLDEAWGALMPAIESEGALMRQGAETGFMSLSDGEYSVRFIQMRLSVNPGYFYNNLQSSYTNRVLSRELLRQTRERIEYQVIESYFNLCRGAEMVKLKNETYSRLEANYQDMLNLYKAGTVSRFDLLQAQLQLKNSEPEIIQAKSNEESSLDQFNFILGEDKNTYTAVRSGEVVISALPDDQKFFERLASAALNNRPEVVQLKLTGEILEQNRKSAASFALWPTFSVSGYYGMTKSIPNPVSLGIPGPVQPDMSQITGNDKWQNTWQVRAGATYRWSAWLPWDASNKTSREMKMRYDESALNQAAVKRTIYNSVLFSIRKLQTAYAVTNSRKSAVMTAQEGLRIAQTSFKAGVLKNTELLSSQLSFSEASTGYIQSLYDYYIAVALLKKETGIYDSRILFNGDLK